ncbi:MAG: cation:proton antiporter [Treponema sp.]|nr:cation:proton antiporter [Treponema sp.]
MNVTEVMAGLALQIGVILFAVRLGGRLVKKAGIPSVLGEMLAGVAIGPYALGSIPFPGFPGGLFSLGEALNETGGALAISPELYGFASIASIILLFASGLETDLGLFLRYSVVGGIIGLGGVIVSFTLGALSGVLLGLPLMDPRCLFLGILSTATSVGITARILQDHKKMDSPEGVTILAAAVFDDVLGIIALAVVLGIVAVLTGSSGSEGLSAAGILAIAGKAFGIWLGFTALGLIFSKQLGNFLKLFKSSFDFSVLALGIALVLSGIFEKQGLAMIIGAYVSGLSLSKTDIAAVILDRLRSLYEFFVPLFFAVMGMMVNVKEIVSPPVLIFGAVYTALAVTSKIIGCGVPALALGFNGKGALRIGAGMIPRGEVALIIAGIGLAMGILDNQIFAGVILMTLVTTLVAPPLLSVFLKLSGSGARKPSKDENNVQSLWDFQSDEISDLVTDRLLKDLRSEGFYVQTMNMDEGISQARKNDISLSITRRDNTLSIETDSTDMPFVKTAVYEVLLHLSDTIETLKSSFKAGELKKEIAGLEGRTEVDVLSLITPSQIILDLKGETKNQVIEELVDLLASRGKLAGRAQVLEAVLQREASMSTGMEHGIALPHAKTDGVDEICVAVGVKRKGVDFDSMDGEKSRLFIMVISPRKVSGPHIQFLAAISAVLRDEALRESVIASDSRDEAAMLLRAGKDPR